MMIDLPNTRLQAAATAGVAGLLLTLPVFLLGLANHNPRFALSDFPVTLFVV